MASLSADESARRLRAMWGYSMLEQDDFLRQAGVTDIAAGQRMLRRTTPSKAPEELLVAAATAVGFPSTFALEGPAAITPDEPSLAERIEALEEQVKALVRQIGADERRRPPGALGQEARGSSPNPPRPEQTDSDRAEDDPRDTGEA